MTSELSSREHRDPAMVTFWRLLAIGLDPVLGAVNALLDLVKASGIKLAERRRRALYSIADYCTISKDLTKYLEEERDYSSSELADAVL